MFIPKRLWRLVEAAGTAVWLVSLAAGIAVTVAAALYGAFEGLPRLAQVVAVILVFALASIVILEVIQYGRLQVGRIGRPKVRVNAGTGLEYQISVRAPDQARNAIEATFLSTLPEDEKLTWIHTIALRVAESANIRATNVVTRLVSSNPPLEQGEYSFPEKLQFTHGEPPEDLEPGGRLYVILMTIMETSGTHRLLSPFFFLRHDPITLGVEVLVDDKRADLRYFKVSGHTTEVDGRRVVAPGPATVVEVPDLYSE